MLVLTRKIGETIAIGNNITVRVVEIEGRHVRLGIEAPTDISVHRGEVYERIMRENIAASKAEREEVGVFIKAWQDRDSSK
ncbi:MAG: carbon storage regulator CsrA [Candidatus Latescibacteria bacterium]|nr:carbon storage regulator CsrA [Candidatus Latescibacterota bacterium]